MSDPTEGETLHSALSSYSSHLTNKINQIPRQANFSLLIQAKPFKVTECEIFLSLIIKFLDGEKELWQRALALEVLHKVGAAPPLLARICENYDLKPHATNVLQDMLGALAGYVQGVFASPPSLPGEGSEDGREQRGSDGVPGFLFKRTWLPLTFLAPQGTPKAQFLEYLDKHEAPPVHPGYCLSLAYAALTDAAHSVANRARLPGQSPDLSVQMLRSSYVPILNALSLLLEASCDENITERLLKSLSLLVSLSCDLGEAGAREGCLGAQCRAALPPHYLARIIPPSSFPSAVPVWERESGGSMAGTESGPANVVAMGTPCPTPWLPPSALGQQLPLTTKNLQHLAWILGLRPVLGGGWKPVGSGGGETGAVLTTAVLADLPVLGAMLNKLFQLTKDLDEVSVHHVIGGLVKLSGDSLVVANRTEGGGREPSFFAVAKLLHVGLVNLHRRPVFWKPLTAHLLELAASGYAPLREWGAGSVVALVKAGFEEADKTPPSSEHDKAGDEVAILKPLVELSRIGAEDVRRKQIECTLGLLRARAPQLQAPLWPQVIGILGDAAGTPEQRFGESVIKAGYGALAFLISDCLPCLPDLDCLRLLIEVDAKYGGQPAELNTSLSAVGQLWTISDYLYRTQKAAGQTQAGELEKLWLCLYTALSDLCVDNRPPVRKSACQTLLQTAASHGASLLPHTWQLMLWNVLFPMMERVRAVHGGASKEKLGSKVGAGSLLIHHSRDTESKQWAETSASTLGALVRIMNAQRGSLLLLPDFPKAWEALLGYLHSAATNPSAEVSLAGLRAFLELLGGGGGKSGEDGKNGEKVNTDGEAKTSLPGPCWTAAWRQWLTIGEALAGIEEKSVASGGVVTREPGERAVGRPPHLTALLQLFPPIFEKVHSELTNEDWRRWGRVLEGVVSLPVATEDAPFILPTSADVTPTQEAVLTALNLVYEKGIEPQSKVRAHLSDLFQLLTVFVTFAVKGPVPRLQGGPKACGNWVASNYVPFSELCLRRLVEFYSATAHLAEIIQAGTLTSIVQCLGVAMSAKYACPRQSTWRLAVGSLLTLLRLALPIARQHPTHFKSLWSELANTLEGFLFPAVPPSESLSEEEELKHELLDVEVVEVIRSQLLPNAAVLPPSFLTRLIEILNRGSLALPNQSGGGRAEENGARGAMGTVNRQRRQLSKACFQALLALSAGGGQPDLVKGASSSFGTEAVLSLLGRARTVVGGYMEAERLRGPHLPLSQNEEAEMESVLGAVLTLIASLHTSSADPEVWGEVMGLYPLLVDCIPTRSPGVQSSLIAALKAYHPLLKPPTSSPPSFP